MVLGSGTRLGRYEIVAPIGAGGMGEVYRARDTKLGRDVAIKVLPEKFSGDPKRLARFDREAKLLAALNHPNVATLYGLEESKDQQFLTMELVEGDTLAERISRGPMRVSDVPPLFVQIADGLEAAHEKGVVHRDLKPANIKITPEGNVKILDFGLAKELLAEAGSAVTSQSPTLSKDTALGAIMGTAPYMSPEQARGQVVDKRTDIWSFGCCLFEALTGKLAFAAPTTSDTIAAILDRDPDWGALPNSMPPSLHRLLHRCLVKAPRTRLRDVGDARLDLIEAASEPASRVQSSSFTSNKLGLAVALAFVLTAAGTVAVYLGRSPDGGAPALRGLVNPTQVSSTVGVEDHPSWSPDGRMLAYQASRNGAWDSHDWEIWVQQIGDPQPLNRTAQHSPSSRYPSWSPDGREIAFSSTTPAEGAIYVMSALAGSVRRVSPPESFATGTPQWSSEGDRLAYPVCQEGVCEIEIVSLQTHEQRRVPIASSTTVYEISWSHDESLFAYVSGGGPLTFTRLFTVRVGEGKVSAITSGETNVRSPSWSEDGRRLYFVSNRGGALDLWVQPIGDDGEPVGSASPATTALGIRSAAFTLDGTRLAVSRGRRVSNVWRIPILESRPATWEDAEQLTFEQSLAEHVDVSRDGEKILFDSDRGGNPDIWELSLANRELKQLTFTGTGEWAASWSPSEDAIAFHSLRDGAREIWLLPLDGSPQRRLTRFGTTAYNPEWSPDGEKVAFWHGRELWVVPRAGGQAKNLVTIGHTRVDWSPDGQTLVFVSAERGRPLSMIHESTGEVERLSDGPAGTPRWSPDGETIYFAGALERAGNLWAFSLRDRTERVISDLRGRAGSLEAYALATDGAYVYFCWAEDLGDIWVMDVLQN